MSEDKLMVGKLVIEPSSSIDEIVRLNTEIIELKAEIERLKNPWRPIKSEIDLPLPRTRCLWQWNEQGATRISVGHNLFVSESGNESKVQVDGRLFPAVFSVFTAWMPLPEPYKEFE